MIHVLDDSFGPLLAVKAEGEISGRDYRMMIPVLENKIRRFKSIRWFFELADDHRWTINSLFDDLLFDVKNGKNVERCAIINARPLEKILTNLIAPFFGGEIKFFDRSHREDALVWLRQNLNVIV